MLDKLAEAGRAQSNSDGDCDPARAQRRRSRRVNLRTAPYPAFPTDMQAQFMALMTRRRRHRRSITETIFENRFMHVQELARLGADIERRGQHRDRQRRRRG